MKYLTTILLCAGIVLAAFGMYINNLILTGIGGFFIGIYNAIILRHRTKL